MKSLPNGSLVSNAYQKTDQFFISRKSRNIEYRVAALKRLKRSIKTKEDAICNALYRDFKKPKFESLATETQFVLAEINYMLSNMRLWAKPKSVSTSLSNFPSKDYVQYEPYGQVLVIAPWNYPFQLCIAPLVGAIAAGNTVVVKPSEITPYTASILKEIIADAFEEGHVAVVEGGVEVSQELLQKKWDYIFFTGSTRVGKIIYQSAAKYLTPVTLELGGKNPCVVDQTTPISLTAKRIVWGKFLNAGQTCIAPDYILVHASKKEKLIQHLIKNITLFYGEDIEKSTDYSRIASINHFKKLQNILSEESILFGGNSNIEDHYIEPTLLDTPKLESNVMLEEIFGPILPILTYTTKEELHSIISANEKPLALYVFSKNKAFQNYMMTNFTFGGGAINDTIIQITNKKLPFGGVGNSGIGSYHGQHSFELFSHKKGIIKKANWLDLPLRYAPYKLPNWIIKKIKLLF